jgi:Ca-activated chloride channel family protein
LQYNEGAAAYKAGEFPQAAQAFQASINVSQSGNAKRLAEQEDAYYNLGNTLYREGQKNQQGNAEQTIQTWTQAVKAYDAALQLRAEDADSKFNRDLVSRKLAALKKEQSEKKPPSNLRNHRSNRQSRSRAKAETKARTIRVRTNRARKPGQGQFSPVKGTIARRPA